MKKLIGISLFIVCTVCLGACSSLPAGPGASDAANYGSSSPR
jgi:hypothetical protein